MTRSRRTAVTTLVVVAWIAWLVAPLVYGTAWVTTWNFTGDPATAGERRSQEVQVVVAMVLSLGIPALALGASLWERRRVAAALLSAALVLALVPPAVIAVEHLRQSSREVPQDDDRPGQCAELSGGTSDCPGG